MTKFAVREHPIAGWEAKVFEAPGLVWQSGVFLRKQDALRWARKATKVARKYIWAGNPKEEA